MQNLLDRILSRDNLRTSLRGRPVHFELLGYAFVSTYKKGERGKYDLRVARKSWQRLKMKIKANTRKTTPASLEERIERLNSLMYGWVGYFQMGKIWGKLRELDAWVRNRLRYCTRLPDGQVWSRFINREEETQPPNARIPAAWCRIRNRLLLVTFPYGRLGYRPVAHHAYHGNGGTPH